MSKLQKLLLLLIFLTVALAPLYVVRWQYFGLLPTTLLESILLITFAVWGFDKLQRRDFSFPKTNFDKIILFFGIASFVTTFVSVWPIQSIGRWRAFVLEPILFYYLIIDLNNRIKASPLPQEHFRIPIINKKIPIRLQSIVMLGLLTAATWLAALGIVQYLLQLGVVTPDQFNRAHGVYNSGNQLAHVLGPIILVFIPFIAELPNKAFHLGILGLLLFAFIFTNSLGGYIGLGAGILVLMLSRYLRPSHLSKLIRSGIVIVSIIFILFLTQIKHITPTVDNPWQRPGGTALIRLCVWDGTFELIKARPIFGAGMAGFSELYGTQYYTCDAEPLEDADNIILNFWTKAGLLGLLTIGWFVLQALSPRYILAFQLPFIYWFYHGMVDVPYFKNDLSLYWWVFAALLIITPKRSPSTSA